jgi:hypothetical protein
MNCPDMAGRTLPDHPERRLIGIGLQPCDELSNAIGGEGSAAEHPERRACKQGDRLEIVEKIVADVVDGAAEDVGDRLADADRVAVWRRAGEAGDADGPSRAGDILDDHRLAEREPHSLGNDPRDGIGRTAWREGLDHGDRARRVALPMRRHGQADGAKHGENSRSQSMS